MQAGVGRGLITNSRMLKVGFVRYASCFAGDLV